MTKWHSRPLTISAYSRANIVDLKQVALYPITARAQLMMTNWARAVILYSKDGINIPAAMFGLTQIFY